MFSFFFFFSRFLTPARACTRYPAKHESKGLTWGLDTAEHCLHCYVDHNNGFTAVVTTLHEAKRTWTQQLSPQPTSALPLPFMRYVKDIPNEVTSR